MPTKQRSSVLGSMVQGFRASLTLNNINLSETSFGGADAFGGVSQRGAGGGVIPLVGNKFATYEMLYRTQPWVRAAVDRMQYGVGRLPLNSYIDGELPGERTRQRTGPLADLLAAPAEGMTPSNFKQAITFGLALHSNVVAVKRSRRAGEAPRELITSSFGEWYIERGKTRPIDWFYWRNPMSGAVIPFLPEEVIHFKMHGGGDGVLGVAKMEALRTTLMNEDASQRAIISSFESGMRVTGAYSVDGQLKPDNALRLRAQLNEAYGGVDNAYKIMLLEGGAKWQNMTQNFQEAELMGLRKMNREEVAAVFGIPATSIGILDHATFSNIDELHRSEYQDTLQPYTTEIEEALALQLIRGEPAFADQYVEFNFKEILRGDPIKEIQAGTAAVGGPWMTPNEFRATQNLPPLPDASANQLRPAPNASLKQPPASGGQTTSGGD